MRFRLKRTLQITALCGCVLLYINFFLVAKSTITLDLNDAFSNRELKGNHHGAKLKVGQFHVVTEGEKPLPVIYPSEEFYSADRILEQLRYIPDSVQRARDVKLKTILLPGGLGSWGIKRGQETFLEQKCLVNQCQISDNRKDQETADVVLFYNNPPSNMRKPPHQAWLLYLLESPYHTPSFTTANDRFNWTATYRHDSTITAPYEKFVPYNASVLTLPQTRNFAEGKTKKVAWFVSNCGARNKRRQYADELAKYIEVDIYGNCGKLKCPRFKSNECFEMLNKDYKFYLSFENSNCRDYITEKFFVNGLKHDVLPIVMGGAPEDYKRAAPPHSYIHVDEFESAEALAKYLHRLDTDDKLYNEYFQWKGTGDIINTYFWCRVCALAHDIEDRGPSWYHDVNAWWRGEDVCIGQYTWRQKPRHRTLIADLPHEQRPRRLPAR